MRPTFSAARDIGASFAATNACACRFNNSCTRAHVTQMAFAEHHNMINAFPAD
jgi:hypothetical protein